MTLLGGLISRVGLVALGGSSNKEIDAETTYFNPLDNHGTTKPAFSLNWYWSVFGRDAGSASDTNGTTRQLCPVAGRLRDHSLDVGFNSVTDGTQLIVFRINGSENTCHEIPASTTGQLIATDLNFEFEAFDRVNFKNRRGTGTVGNVGFQTASVIEWD